MPRINPKIPVKVSNLSGFDKSFRNSGTLKCGTITPILCDELIPNSRVSLRINLASQLPPLVSDTYMNLKLKVEAFFTPSRLLCKSFEPFFCDFPAEKLITGRFEDDSDEHTYVLDNELKNVKPRIPVCSVPADLETGGSPNGFSLSRGSLADYLGMRVKPWDDATDDFVFNILPFVNYHLVWQEYYRNPRVQKPAFVEPLWDARYPSQDQATHGLDASNYRP